MPVEESRNKQIAKNAMALYFRMIITMLVGLYTSRLILQALGVVDYGIYNVVGGFVSMFDQEPYRVRYQDLLHMSSEEVVWKG